MSLRWSTWFWPGLQKKPGTWDPGSQPTWHLAEGLWELSERFWDLEERLRFWGLAERFWDLAESFWDLGERLRFWNLAERFWDLAKRFGKNICSGSRFFCRPGFGTAESRHVRDDVGRGGGDPAVVVPPGDQDVAVIAPVG